MYAAKGLPVDRREDAARPSATGLRERLRSATATLHQEIERRLDLVGPRLTIDRYRRTLAGFYGYYQPLEDRLGAVPAAIWSNGFSPKRRAPLLERDLAYFGVSPEGLAALPRASELPALAGRADVAGCLYVVEGAALGGRVISRAIAERLRLGPSHGGAFFFGDGPWTGQRWQRLLAWLAWIDAQAGDPAFGDLAVARACETFSTLGDWLESTLAAP